MTEILAGLWMPLAGLATWLLVIQGRCRRLAPEAGSRDGLGAFALGWLGGYLLMAPLLSLLLPADLPEDTPPGEYPLTAVLGAQALAFGLSTLGALAWLRARGGRLADAGLTPPRGPPSLVAAASAWLALTPLLALAQLAGAAALDALGLDPGPQAHLERFLDQDGGSSRLAWLTMALWLPFCEEVLYRGLLFGGLRRLMPPWLAMLASGLAFGLAHDLSVAVPVALLGTALAWLYERTGSLTVPILVHCLQNGATLWLASAAPELVPGCLPL